MRGDNSLEWQELTNHGFGASMSGEPFSSVHGDYITETTINREEKLSGGPMRGGYSTNSKPWKDLSTQVTIWPSYVQH